MNNEAIAYMTGLIEGDGSIFVDRSEPERRAPRPGVQLLMKDKDTVSAFAAFVNSTFSLQGQEKSIIVRDYPVYSEQRSDLFVARVRDRRAEALMRIFYPGFFSHRRAQVESSLAECQLPVIANQNTKITEQQILTWLAGLYEAEGCFKPKRTKPKYQCVRLHLGMTDEDIIVFAASWLNRTFPPQGSLEKVINIYRPGPRQLNRKAMFHIELHSRRAAALMIRLRPYMSIRRIADIDDSLDIWKAQEKRHPKECSIKGCHESHLAKTYCSLHYQRVRRGIT